MTPRMRMFAGPNGSGKTTIKTSFQKPDKWFGVYYNADEIEARILNRQSIDCIPDSVHITNEDLNDFFINSQLLKSKNIDTSLLKVSFLNRKIIVEGIEVRAYVAAVFVDYLRQKTLNESISFTFETVMSSRDKIELLEKAQERGYRTYLYFVATEDPLLNVKRVEYRVLTGGHCVPADKIIERYHRTMQLLPDAIYYSNRAYFFDNSLGHARFFAEAENRLIKIINIDDVPDWFEPVLERYPYVFV